MPHPFDSFRFVVLRCTLVAQTSIEFRDWPEIAATVRSQFGGALVHAVCRREPPCLRDACAAPSSCPFGTFFKGNGESGLQPYVFYVDEHAGPLYQPGAMFEFDITLFGSGIAYYPVVISAVQRLAWNDLGFRAGADAGGVWWLATVDSIGDDSSPETRTQIYDGRRASFVAIPVPRTWDGVVNEASQINEDRVRIVEVAPMWVKRNGAGLENISLADFAAILLRRLNGLAQAYCGAKGQVDPDSLLAELTGAALETVKPGRNGRGQYWLNGNPRPILPYLVLGKYTHIGKKASLLGRGRYDILFGDQT